MCSVKNTVLAASSTGEGVNVTILGTKFGQSNEGGGSTGERGGGGWKGTGISFPPPPPPPPLFPRPKLIPQALIGD